MSPDDRDTEEHEPERYEIEPPRSVFSALWFRVVAVVVVVGVLAAVAVPYVLDWMNPPPAPRTAETRSSPPAPKPAVQPVPAPSPVPAPASTSPERREPSPAPAAASAVPAPPAPKVATKEAEARANGVEEKAAPPARRTRREPARRPARAAVKAPAKASAAPDGSFFVQVGAFKDREHAGQIATRLRGRKFRVEESTTGAGEASPAAPEPSPSPSAGPSPTDRYDVFVTGGSVATINAKLAAKGLATEAAGSGVVVRPSLPLRDAVALSKDLATEGMKVRVRRAVGGAPRPSPAPARPRAGGGDVLYRVRVGPFPDRGAAREALDALKEIGYRDCFIARGGT